MAAIPDVAAVERLLHEAYIAAEGTRLRDEDRRKAHEVAALLVELGRAGRNGHLVDAAAGKAYVGVLAAATGLFERVTVLEREPARIDHCRRAAERLGVAGRVVGLCADVASPAAWPSDADVVVALHACGAASDHVIDAAVRTGVTWLFLVPCCYDDSVPFARDAEAAAGRAGVAYHGEIRRRLVSALIDTERTLRLEAAGWETTVVAFVPPTVTPHNLLWRSRKTGEPVRMAQAAEALHRLQSP